ncbi:MAG: hypothetical protein COS85_11830 [Armatimonadetes bacterium CG07_land_8_20_14_0_80_59_28]|nr:MAG: hypothetical protein COS85_11830 [Armatimonadetes bacterium CG07_land_8_20_14_0_80_59_28]
MKFSISRARSSARQYVYLISVVGILILLTAPTIFADSTELQKAKVLKDTGQHAEAAKVLEEMVKVNPEDAEAHRLPG